MSVVLHSLLPMLAKLERWAPLSEADRSSLLGLPHSIKRIPANGYIVREGDKPTYSCILLSGFAVRHKMAGDGGRQILSMHMVGDVVDLQNSLLGVADHNVQTLTDVDAAYIPVSAIEAIAASQPVLGRALWRETLVEAAIFREWILNVGRRDARTRTAHFLCELGLRLEAAGLGERDRFRLPVTQEQLADMLGLTPVHINRTLRSLDLDHLIARDQRSISILEWDKLSQAGDFDPIYLHLRGAEPTELAAVA